MSPLLIVIWLGIWHSLAVSASDGNLVTIGTYIGLKSKESWFLTSATNTPQWALSDEYLNMDYACQIRIYMVGLQEVHEEIFPSGSASLSKSLESAPFSNCVFITDKGFKVSKIKVFKS